MKIQTPSRLRFGFIFPRLRFGFVSPRLRFGLVCAAAVFFCVPLSARAAEKIGPAAMARTLAPYVDTETILVAHVDPSRVSLAPIVNTMARLAPEADDGLTQAEKDITQWLDALRRQHVSDLYLVVSLGGRSLIPRMTLVVSPADPKRDLAALRAALKIPSAIGLEAASLPAADVRPLARPELADAMEAAGEAAIQIALIPPASSRRVIEEIMPQLPPQIGGGASTVVTHGVSWAAAAIDLAPAPVLRLTIKSQDAAAAEALRAKWADVLRIAGQQKVVQQALPDFEKVAAMLVPKLAENRLTLTIDEKDVVGAGQLVQRATANALNAARRTQSMNNVKQLALAVINCEESARHFPPPASHSPDGKPLLSWRVAILPYMDQDQLYKQFHLDEPWDSPHNKALIDKMPAVFRSPKSRTAKGYTNYVVPVGNGALYASHTEEPTYKDIKDGTSHTLMLVEVDDAHAVVWTKPDDLDFDPQDPKKGIGSLYEEGFIVAFCDGSVQFLRRTIKPETLKAQFTRAAGDAFSSDDVFGPPPK